MKLQSYSLLGLLALAACEKKQATPTCDGSCVTIQGRVLTGGLQGLAGATIELKLMVPYSYGYSMHDKASATTDADGNYELRFFIDDEELKSKAKALIFYQVNEQQYYIPDTNNTVLFDAPGRGTVYQLLPYFIARKANVKLTVPNSSQIPYVFALYFLSTHGQFNTSTGKFKDGAYGVYVTKQNAPFTRSIAVAADQKVYILAERTVNGTTTYTKDSLVATAGTTRNLSIDY